MITKNDNIIVDVSIIIPVYNGAKTLEQCITSVLKQDYPYFQLIIVDDGSTDGSQIICKKFLDDSRVNYIYQDNQGLRVATKNGLSLVETEYTMFLDMDDWYLPSMIGTLIKAIKIKKSDCVLCGYLKCSSQKSEVVLPIRDAIYNKQEIQDKILTPFFEKDGNIYRYWSAPRWDKIYKTSLLRKTYDELDLSLIAGEDLEMNLRYLSKCSTVCSLADSYLYCYRVLDKSMAHGYTQKHDRQYTILVNAIKELANELGYNGYGLAEFEDNCTISLLTELNHTTDIDNKKAIRKALISKLHSKFRILKVLLQRDFPGKEVLQRLYRSLYK